MPYIGSNCGPGGLQSGWLKVLYNSKDLCHDKLHFHPWQPTHPIRYMQMQEVNLGRSVQGVGGVGPPLEENTLDNPAFASTRMWNPNNNGLVQGVLGHRHVPVAMTITLVSQENADGQLLQYALSEEGLVDLIPEKHGFAPLTMLTLMYLDLC